MADKSGGHFGGEITTSKLGGTSISVATEEKNTMGDRPGGMDNIPSTFNVGKKADKGKTDMGKVAKIAHVNVKDRGVKGVSSSEKGGGKHG